MRRLLQVTRSSSSLPELSEPERAAPSPVPSPIPEIIDDDDEEDYEVHEDRIRATVGASGAEHSGPTLGTHTELSETAEKLDSVQQTTDAQLQPFTVDRLTETTEDTIRTGTAKLKEGAESAESTAGMSVGTSLSVENAGLSTPAVLSSIDMSALHTNQSSTGGNDVGPADSEVETISLPSEDSGNGVMQTGATEILEDGASTGLLGSTSVTPAVPPTLDEDAESIPMLQPVPMPLDPIESATIDLRIWLRSHDAERHTGIIVASFIDAGYEPHEWVDTMREFSPDDLSAFLDAVSSPHVPEPLAVAEADANLDGHSKINSTQKSDSTHRQPRDETATVLDREHDAWAPKVEEKAKPEPCASVPCQNGGKCSADLGVFWCDCLDGYRGETCAVDADECASRPCRNGATCLQSGTAGVVNVGRYTCVCANGWQGVQCDEDVDECLTLPCQNGGVCDSQEFGAYKCECQPGFEGDTCGIDTKECASNPCANSGACVESTPPVAPFFLCDCSIGFAGTDCGIDIDECESTPCQNGGACMDSVAAYTCQCSDGFSGVNCDKDVPCASTPCQNGGSCVSDSSLSSAPHEYSCLCLAGFEGGHCATDLDECASQPCENGGACVDGPAMFTCNCTAGFGGDLCSEDEDECASKPCANGGTCTQTPFYTTAAGAVPVAPYYSCDCPEGFQGENCNVDIDECESSPCQHGAECKQGVFQRGGSVARFSCICPDGLAGELCERDINECISSPCLNGATCGESNSDSSIATGSFVCNCLPGFHGVICAEDVDECASRPCKHGGACVEAAAPNFFRCLCREGFAGAVCDAEVLIAGECDSQPCQNGGICEDSFSAPGVVTPGYFLCDCQHTGFAGVLCDIGNTQSPEPAVARNVNADSAETEVHITASDEGQPSQNAQSNISFTQTERSTERVSAFNDVQTKARESALKQLLATQNSHGASVVQESDSSLSTEVDQLPVSSSDTRIELKVGQLVSEPEVERPGSSVDALPKATETVDKSDTSTATATTFTSAQRVVPGVAANDTATRQKAAHSNETLETTIVAVDDSVEVPTPVKLLSPRNNIDERAETPQPAPEAPTLKPAAVAAAKRLKSRTVAPLSPDAAPGNEIFGGSSMAFLDVRQIGDIKLVKLQNTVCGFDPACGEWQGDWSDNSTQWEHHPRVTQMLKPQFLPDGVFWMPFDEYQKRFHGSGPRKTTAAPYTRGDRTTSRPVQRNGRSTELSDTASLRKDESQEEAKPSAAEFLASVREHFDGGLGYAYFLRALKLYSTGNQTATEVHVVVRQLFQNAPQLMKGFNALVPPPETPQEGDQTTATQQDHDVRTNDTERNTVQVEIANENDAQQDPVPLMKTAEDQTDSMEIDGEKKNAANLQQTELRTDPCSSTPCVAGGTCTPDPGSERGFNCTCASGYTGVSCQTAECPAGYWESATGGRACAPLSVCNFTFQYEALEPNKTRDRVCLDIRQPCDPESEVEVASPSKRTDRICRLATICQPGLEYEATPLSGQQDRVCHAISPPCAENSEWEASPPTAYRDRACRAVTKCAEHQLERLPPGPSMDRVCFGLAEVAAEGSFSLVAQLLSRGNSVDVNAKNEYGHTALHEIAAATSANISSHDRLAVVDKLVESGADVAAQNSKGHTALHIAADVGNADAASALLARRGVDVNAVDGEGNTPLHFAAEMGHSAVAEVLLEGGATVARKNVDGRTPAHLTDAIRWHEDKYREIVRVLKRYGGELRRHV